MSKTPTSKTPTSKTPTSKTREAARDDAISAAAILRKRPLSAENVWTQAFVWFLRGMAVVAILKGLFHWARLTGFVGSGDGAFEDQSVAWQAATVYFAVIDLVAAVGLWLATPWGAVVWLTSLVSMVVMMFPGILGGSVMEAVVMVAAVVMVVAYIALAWMAARERPP